MKKTALLLLFVLLLPLTATTAQSDVLLEVLDEYDIGAGDPAVVIYVYTPEGEFSAAAGMADIAANEFIGLFDRFRIGSVTKTFVATVILQLVDEGLIDLDAYANTYLPEEMDARIENLHWSKVRDLLNMTSGIYDYTESDAFDDAVYDDPTHPWTAAEVIAFTYDQMSYFDVGLRYYYSNSNYILLQLIAEAVTGQPLADLLQERIFEPVGMASCALEDPTHLGEDLVRGYWWEDGGYVDITEVNDGVGLGDGGIVCNAMDLAQFPPALFNGDLLSAAMRDEMLTLVDDDFDGYGLGIGVIETEFGTLYGHDGATSGFQAQMQYLWDEGIVVVILTNDFDSEIIEDLLYDVLEAVVE